MAVVENDEIGKRALIDNFKNNLLSAMMSGVVQSTNIPRFSGSAGPFTSPAALPANQIAMYSDPTVNISSDEVSASNTYNALKVIVDGLTRIRYFTSNWYFQTNNSQGLVNSISGTALFNATIPSLPTYNAGRKANGYSGWARTIAGTGAGVATNAAARITSSLSVANPMVINNVVNASNLTPRTLTATFFNNLFNAWASNRNNRITYNFYTCHSNCHASCNPRSRR